MHADSTVIETSSFAGLPTAAGSGGGVLATERDGLGIARIVARKGQGVRLAELLRASFGVELPHGPTRVSHGDVGIAGIAPQTWLATRDGAGNGFAQSLRQSLVDCASVSDQSDAHAILRLTGPSVRAALAKLTPIDIHPRSFPVNSVAQTLCGYVNVTLWRLEDSQGDPVFEIWAGRSLAVSLHQAISHGAVEFGFVRQTR
jgi:methylglutamate dehydrogenase subunit D